MSPAAPLDTRLLLDQGGFYQRLFEVFAEKDVRCDLFSVTLGAFLLVAVL